MKMIKLAHIGIICLMSFATLTSAYVLIVVSNDPDLHHCGSLLRETKNLCIKSDQTVCIEDELVLQVCTDLNRGRMFDWRDDVIKNCFLFSAWMTALVVCVIYLKKTVERRGILVLIFLGVFAILFLAGYWIVLGSGRGEIEPSGFYSVKPEIYDRILQIIAHLRSIPSMTPN